MTEMCPHTQGLKRHSQVQVTLAAKLSKISQYFHVSHSCFCAAKIIPGVSGAQEIFSLLGDLRDSGAIPSLTGRDDASADI